MRSMIPTIRRSNEVDGTALLIRVAFVQAVRRRFAGATRADVIRFVAHARTEGLTDLQRAQHIIMLSELTENEQPTDEGLEAILAEARTYAEQLAATL